jgi:hypothetical protein
MLKNTIRLPSALFFQFLSVRNDLASTNQTTKYYLRIKNIEI